MSNSVKKYFCPRLIDYIIMVGPRTSDMDEGQTSPSLGGHNRVPHLLRRYPPEDHQDFVLPPDVVIFCQPEGCDRQESHLNAYNNPSQTTNSFVFLLTEKDTSRVRYGVCLNFYRPLQKCPHKQHPQSDLLQQQDQLNGGQEKHSSFQDNESGIKVSIGPDSDSVASSGGGGGGAAAGGQPTSQQQPGSDNTSTSFGGTDSMISSNSGSRTHHHHHHSSSSTSRHYNNRVGGGGVSATGAGSGKRSNTPGAYQQQQQQQQQQGKEKSKITYALNSICIISHHPFFSTFRECLYIMKKFIQATEDRNMNATGKEQPPKCKCHAKLHQQQQQHQHQHQHQRSRRSSLQSHVSSQISRKSAPPMMTNYHSHNCPYFNPIWSLLTMPDLDELTVAPNCLVDVAEIEAWCLRLLSVPVPVPERTKIELDVLTSALKQPLLFALPDHTRFSLIDFPLHLPLELLGVETCLQVLTCILLEHKVALQSKDYNALSMSVMAFVTMIYPLEYMFPVIPLLPSCMSSAEQLLLAPTPFIIGFPSSFFKFKYNFTLPNDVWIVDLDANRVWKPTNADDLPPLPEHEGRILTQNLQKILNSMSGPVEPTSSEPLHQSGHLSAAPQNKLHAAATPQTRISKITNESTGQSSMPTSPYKRRSSMAAAGQLLQFAADRLSGGGPSSARMSNVSSSPASSTRSSFALATTSAPAFDPIAIIGNDTDAVDVAVRIAMVRFFNSQEVLANFIEHTRTIRLYPRPVVSFQKSSFIQSRARPSQFLMKLVETQAVEYMAEWALSPDNVAFQRIHTGVYDPASIGDKPKWYGQQLESLQYEIWDLDKKEFYDEIAQLIRESSGASGAASSTGRFSDYYDDNLGDKGDSDDGGVCGDENNNANAAAAVVVNRPDSAAATAATAEDLDSDEQRTPLGVVSPSQPPQIYDINNNNNLVLGVGGDEDDHCSAYMSSNDSSPCYSSDRETENVDKHLNNQAGGGGDANGGGGGGGGRALTLNDVMNSHLRKCSISSSISSTGSWDSNHIMESIPANYHHDTGRFPPLRCDLEKYYHPPSGLVRSREEGHSNRQQRQQQNVATKQQTQPDTTTTKMFPSESSDDEADDTSSNRIPPDSSSCDEESIGAGEDDYDLGAKDRESVTDLTNENVIKLFDSMDSDTIVPSSNPTDNSCTDENNNNNLTIAAAAAPLNIKTMSINESIDSITTPQAAATCIDTNNNQQQRAAAAGAVDETLPPNYVEPSQLGSTTADTVNAILSTQKARMTNSVAKLIDRASSISDQKFLRQGSQSSGGGGAAAGNQSPLPKNIGGEQMGAFFDRFTTEARGAVKEAKAAIDAGKNALKTTAMPAADASRQKIMKNFQNFGESLFDERRDSSAAATKPPSEDSAANHDQQPESLSSSDSRGSQSRPSSRGSDFNAFAGKANSMITGWLGSKATGFANKMRDRTRPMEAFPTIEESVPDPEPRSQPQPPPLHETNSQPPPQYNPARRASLITYRRASIAYGTSVFASRSQMLQSPLMTQTIDADADNDLAFFSGQKLVQKTRLIKHSTVLNDQPEKAQPIRTTQSDGDNQQFLKEVTGAVMKGEGIGWLKLNRLKKLMEDESYRDIVLSQINRNIESRTRPDDRICDVQVSKAVWRGMLRVCLAVVSGLEQSYMHNKLVGMASVFSLLEVAHTHYWTKEPPETTTSTTKSGPDNSLGDGRQSRVDSIATVDENRKVQLDDAHLAPSIPESSQGSRRSSFSSRDSDRASSIGSSSKVASSDQDNSTHSRESSERGLEGTVSDDDGQAAWDPKQGLPQMNQVNLSSGVPLAPLNEDPRVYLYEGFLQKDRSPLWDQVQFWEESFLDAVSHERCLIGMDQGPSEMLERYKLLYEIDKKRLEHEEDRLLSTLLYNMTAFMTMLQVDKQCIKQKIRRLLGKCHIGLVNSAEINQLLEQIESFKGNDIDLKPMASRQVRRQTFTLHRGTDSSGEIVFMEIRDDGLVLRGLDGVVIERWWYERLINITYSPKNKVVCFWRKSDGQTKLTKFYTKKSQELYNCIKESMLRAATTRGTSRVCSELGGEFPVLDVKSGEGGILQVCMEGVGLLFATSKYFVRLENIRKCFTQKGGTFVLEEYNPKSRQLIQKHFKSQMADQICYAILCVFSYVAAGQNKNNTNTNNNNNNIGGSSSNGNNLMDQQPSNVTPTTAAPQTTA